MEQDSVQEMEQEMEQDSVQDLETEMEQDSVQDSVLDLETEKPMKLTKELGLQPLKETLGGTLSQQLETDLLEHQTDKIIDILNILIFY